MGGNETTVSFQKNQFSLNFIQFSARRMALDCCAQLRCNRRKQNGWARNLIVRLSGCPLFIYAQVTRPEVTQKFGPGEPPNVLVF